MNLYSSASGHCLIVLAMLFASACPRQSVPQAGDSKREDAASSQQRQAHFLRVPSATQPMRVVSMAPNVTEIVFALGAGERLVGVTRFCDYPAAAQSLPKIGGFLDPSLEAVAALKPDLIITVPNGQNRVVVERLAEMGFAALLTYAYDIDDVKNSIVAIGDALKLSQRGRDLVAQLETELRAVSQLHVGKARPRVLFLYGHRPLVAAGPGSYAQQLLDIAGGDNVLAASKTRYPTLSLEAVIGYAPDVIIDAYQEGHGEPSETPFADFTTIPAVREHRVYRLQDGAALHPGPRAAVAAKSIASLLHPQSTP